MAGAKLTVPRQSQPCGTEIAADGADACSRFVACWDEAQHSGCFGIHSRAQIHLVVFEASQDLSTAAREIDVVDPYLLLAELDASPGQMIDWEKTRSLR